MRNLPLRAAFSVGQETSITAQQIFTDRIAEVAAFNSALLELREYIAQSSISPVTDLKVPRKNVLVYYGVGGIGKTTLSRELESRFTAPDGKRDPKRAAARFDFSEPASADVESFVLRLRAALGQISPSWPAFDIAFASYWERAHPGEPIREFIGRDSVLRQVTGANGLADQIAEVATQVLGAVPAVGAEAMGTLGKLVVTKSRDAIVRHRTLRKCELLVTLLDAEATLETLSYFPYLLAWDLDRIAERGLEFAAFLDTFEEVTGRGTREAERWLQRCVYLMPNVLFVITSRNSLDWAEAKNLHELDYIGPKRWPNLQAGHTASDPRQHLVGYLSDEDAHRYLAAALMTGDEAAIPEAIRDRIVQAGGGLPLYLDLAVTTYLDLVTQGETPMPEDFGQPLPAVAARILRDLSDDERDLLRVAALVGAFDLDLLRAAYPGVRDSTLSRFQDRTFLEHDTDSYWPYSLHSLLRSALRDADTGLPDSWSSRERDQAAQHVGTYLQEMASAAARRGDRSGQVAAVRMGVELSAGTGQLFGWLIEAIQAVLTAGGWAALADLEGLNAGDELSAVLQGIKGAQERRSGHLEQAVQMMDDALAVPGLPPQLRRFLVLHRAHALRVAGRYADGAQGYRELLEDPEGGFADDARYWLGDYEFLQGRFGDVLQSLDQMPPVSPDLKGECLRLRGHVHRVNALFGDAEASYREALDLARQTSNAAAEGKALTDLLQTLAWRRPQDALAVRADALRVNESLSNRVEIVKVRAAAAVALIQAERFAEADQEIERGLALTRECAYPGGQVWCQVARVLHHLRTGAGPDAVQAARTVATITGELQGNRFWSEIARWWTQDDGEPVTGIDWIGGEDAARSRWLAVYPGPSDHA